jgi:hypothetical protein
VIIIHHGGSPGIGRFGGANQTQNATETEVRVLQHLRQEIDSNRQVLILTSQRSDARGWEQITRSVDELGYMYTLGHHSNYEYS